MSDYYNNRKKKRSRREKIGFLHGLLNLSDCRLHGGVLNLQYIISAKCKNSCRNSKQ